jgi:ATP-dependent Clp protease protease subunit
VVLASALAAAPGLADTPAVPVVPVTPAPPSALPVAASPALLELRKRQEQLTLENNITDQELHKALAALAAEKQRRELENTIAQQKLQAEIAALQAETEKLNRQTEIINKRLTLKEAERRSRLDGELAAAREKLERLRVSNDLAAAEVAAKNRELALKDQELKLRATELQVQRTEFDNQLARLTAEIDLRDKREQWKNRVNAEIKYTKEPYKNGVLTISDRRIKLNGPISMHTADHVLERVNYFNNQSTEYPIFIVIDDSPGGSVQAGYKILKTMSGSRAPVYVVVKAFAASMAATITTLAPRSFAYPNAIILHHQILSGSFGNLTEQREKVKELDEWWKRLAGPVAAKMGLSLDEFIKRMYQNRSTGDWQEFGDRARKLKWVDEIVETINEESYIKNPDAPPPLHLGLPGLPLPPVRHAGASVGDELVEQLDAQGRPYIRLPRLSPVDCYYLYNPDNYYRLTP